MNLQETIDSNIKNLFLSFSERCPHDYTSLDYENLIKLIGQLFTYTKGIENSNITGNEVPGFYGIANLDSNPEVDKEGRLLNGWYLLNKPGVYSNFTGMNPVTQDELNLGVVIAFCKNNTYSKLVYPINIDFSKYLETAELLKYLQGIQDAILESVVALFNYRGEAPENSYVKNIRIEDGDVRVQYEQFQLPLITLANDAWSLLEANGMELSLRYLPVGDLLLRAAINNAKILVDLQIIDNALIEGEVGRVLAFFDGLLHILMQNIAGDRYWAPIGYSGDSLEPLFNFLDCVVLDPNGNLTVRHDDSLYIENSELKVNFHNIDERIANLKDDITDLNTELQEVQSDIKNCKSNIQQIRDEQAEMIEEAVNNKLNSGELELPSYAKKYELDSKIDKRELSQYVDTAVSSLVRANELNAYATKELLDNYVTTEDAESFVTNDKLEERLSTFLPTDLTDYPTKSEVARDYATKSYLSNFATINDLTKMLSNIQIGSGGLSDITVSERDYGLIFGNTTFSQFNYFESAILAFTNAGVFEKEVDWDYDSNNVSIVYLKLSAILKLLILFLMFAADLSLVKTASVTSTDE